MTGSTGSGTGPEPVLGPVPRIPPHVVGEPGTTSGTGHPTGMAPPRPPRGEATVGVNAGLHEARGLR